MSIRVFYIPFGDRGSTENLFRMAEETIGGRDYSDILYITPTYLKVRDSQRRFHAFGGDCYIPPDMMTLGQFSKRLYSLHGEKRIINQSLVPLILSNLSEKGIAFSSVIARFISETKQNNPCKSSEVLRCEMDAVFEELAVPDEIRLRATDALDLLASYVKLMESCSAVDEDDVMAACPDLVQLYDYRYTFLILDGFYELTASEEQAVKSLIEHTDNTLISIPHNDNVSLPSRRYINFINNNFGSESFPVPTERPPKYDSYLSYPGTEEEIEGIAKNIKLNFISGGISTLNDVIITFTDMDRYSEKLARIFKKYGVPHAPAISKPLGKMRPYLDLTALLEAVAEDYPRLPFSQFLSSPYFSKLPPALRESVPRICLESGIIKGKEAWLGFLRSQTSIRVRDRKTRQGKEIDAAEIEKGLKWVYRKLSPLEVIRNAASYVKYSEVIMKLVNDLDFRYVANESSDLKAQLLEILNALSFLDSLDYAPRRHPPSLKDFTKCLGHLLNETRIKTEEEGVQVIGLSEIQGLEPKHLYFGGLKDGDLPSKPDIDHILPDSVRTRLGLLNLEQHLGRQKFMFLRAIDSSENVHLSYPLAEGDRLFLPSPLLPWNREERQRMYGIFSVEESLLHRGKIPLVSHIENVEDIRAFAGKLFGIEKHIRVTDIDSYRTCPRKFLVEKVLGLEPPEIKKYEVEAAFLGTIVHEIMQALMSKQLPDIDDLKAVADEILQRLLSEKPLEDYWKKVIRETFLAILPDLYHNEKRIAEEGYSFMRAEVPVRGEILKGVRLKGKIDRIDEKITSDQHEAESAVDSEEGGCPSFADRPSSRGVVEVIDYKTGALQFSAPQVIAKGATLQLFLYAALMKAMGVGVERVGLYSLKDLRISWVPGRNDKKIGRTLEDYIGTSLLFLEETVLKMRSGDFSAHPLNEQTCRNCPERPYCPYIQKAVTSDELQIKS